jgi:hypothetical protein
MIIGGYLKVREPLYTQIIDWVITILETKICFIIYTQLLPKRKEKSVNLVIDSQIVMCVCVCVCETKKTCTNLKLVETIL